MFQRDPVAARIISVFAMLAICGAGMLWSYMQLPPEPKFVKKCLGIAFPQDQYTVVNWYDEHYWNGDGDTVLILDFSRESSDTVIQYLANGTKTWSSYPPSIDLIRELENYEDIRHFSADEEGIRQINKLLQKKDELNDSAGWYWFYDDNGKGIKLSGVFDTQEKKLYLYEDNT